MKRFILAAGFIVVIGLGTSNKAHAQIMFSQTVPFSTNGVQNNTSGVFTGAGSQTFTNFFSPFTGNVQTTGTFGAPFGGGLFSNTVNPFGGVQTTNTFGSPFMNHSFASNFSPFTGNFQTSGAFSSLTAGRAFSNSFSPFTGFTNQSIHSNIMGNTTTMRSFGFNPWTGMTSGAVFTQPNVMTQFGPSANLGFFRRR